MIYSVKSIIKTGILVALLLAIPKLVLADAPGVEALVKASSDIVVVEVKSTQPRKAIEGARDTAELKVLESLKGSLGKGAVVPLYYHLLWTDAKRSKVEKPKFAKGKHYIVFLQSYMVNNGAGNVKNYNLTDRYLGVVDENPELIKSIKWMMRRRKTTKTAR